MDKLPTIEQDILPQSRKGERLSRFFPRSRRGFCLGTITFFLLGMGGPALVVYAMAPLSFAYLSLTAISAQVILVHQREKAVYPTRRHWRVWYAIVTAFLVVEVMTSHITQHGPGAPRNPDERRAQLMIGGVILFYLVLAPLAIRLAWKQTTEKLGPRQEKANDEQLMTQSE